MDVVTVQHVPCSGISSEVRAHHGHNARAIAWVFPVDALGLEESHHLIKVQIDRFANLTRKVWERDAFNPSFPAGELLHKLLLPFREVGHLFYKVARAHFSKIFFASFVFF